MMPFHKLPKGLRDWQGAKVLIVGDTRAFFTMYRVVDEAGLRAFQLDRSGTLLAAGGNPCLWFPGCLLMA